MSLENVIKRNNIRTFGAGPSTLLFSHGFGCDQSMWRFIAPAFFSTHRVVLFDQIGTGLSDITQYDPVRYDNLHAYANDVLEICAAMKLDEVVFIGHSVSCMIGALAAIQAPERFSKLVMIGPSPCYINKTSYMGGFEDSVIHDMLDYLNDNFEAWAQSMAVTISGNSAPIQVSMELADSFCRFHPAAARQFARLTFLSDNRADLSKLDVPTLILQCSNDPIAPEAVGKYVHAHIAGSTYIQLQADGHCPHMSAPEETLTAIQSFLGPNQMQTANTRLCAVV